MRNFLSFLKQILGPNITNTIRPVGHGIKTFIAAAYYGFPARKLKIIGITGTKGKTTTTVLTGRLANLSGIKSGYISTALINLQDGQGEFLNPYKMTSIDGFVMHKYLREMVNHGCTWVVLEMSSQGLEQKRHWGLFGFDITTFLNLTPEHIEAHGSFEKYRDAKALLVRNIKPHGLFIANELDENTSFMELQIRQPHETILLAQGISWDSIQKEHEFRRSLKFNGHVYQTNFYADFDICNLAFAISMVQHMGFKPNSHSPVEHISELQGIAGRMEWIVQNNSIVWPTKIKNQKKSNQLRNQSKTDVSILVDYAHEPQSMSKLLQTLAIWRGQGLFTEIIHILSCDGAGRDDWKKPILGELSQKYADYTILTTDNYTSQDNPEHILDLLAKKFALSELDNKLFRNIDRRAAFKKALELVEKLPHAPRQHSPSHNVLIVSTGVGSEHGLTQPTGTIEWDEREVWHEMFAESLAQHDQSLSS